MKDARITIRINELEKEKIAAIAAKKDVPIAQIIREAIREYLEKEFEANKQN